MKRPTAPPDVADAAHDAESASALLARIEWTVLRRLDGVLQGDHRTLMRGAGLDLADLREYQLHDDVRHIDWNVTARLQQPYVRQFTEDRELTAWFLVDLSASVDFGSDRLTKRRIARAFTATLARMFVGAGNKVGALLYGREVDTVLPAKNGRRHVLQLIDRMDRRAVEAPDGATDLTTLLEAAGSQLKRRSTVFVVSDFISAPGWERSLGRLALRHDVTAVRLFDPLEMSLPDIGLVTMRDAETGEQLVVDTHDAGFRRRFQRLAAEREQSLRESLAAAGVDALELATDDDLVDAVLRFCDLRRQRSRVANDTSARHGVRGGGVAARRAGGGAPGHVAPSRAPERGAPRLPADPDTRARRRAA